MPEKLAAEGLAPDPGGDVARAMDTALQAARAGAADAKAMAEKAIPGVSLFLSRFVYTTCYTVSYGVVFTSLLVARAVPKDNPAVQGLLDGAKAASERVDQLRSR
jgi:hypothetical protein